MRMTLDSIGKVGLGVEIGSLPWHLPLPDNAFAKAFDFANDTVFWRFIDPSWKLKRFLNVGCEAELLRCIKVLDSFTYGVIAQRKLDLYNARTRQLEGLSQQVRDFPPRYVYGFHDPLQDVHPRSSEFVEVLYLASNAIEMFQVTSIGL